MVTLLHLLLAASPILAGLAWPGFPDASRRTPAAHLAVALASAALAALPPETAARPAALHAEASGTPGDEASEGSTGVPVGHFVRTLKRAIPWLAGLLLVGALAVVVAISWWRKGVLLQDLSAGRGRAGSGEPKVNRKAAAEYLAQVQKRQAAEREKEGRGAADGKNPKGG